MNRRSRYSLVPISAALLVSAAISTSAGCSTAAAELWPTEAAPLASVVDVRVIQQPADATIEENALMAIAQAVVAAPGSRVRIFHAVCSPSLVIDETSGPLPTRPRAVPRFVERETARLVDRMRSANAAPPARRRGLCLAEAITLAASADAVPDADEVHVVVLSSLAEMSGFARLERGRLPSLRILNRRATAQRLLPAGSLAGIRVHLAGRGATRGTSFGRSQAELELWLGLLENAGAPDVMVTSGAPVLDDGVRTADADEED